VKGYAVIAASIVIGLMLGSYASDALDRHNAARRCAAGVAQQSFSTPASTL
jgi:hypothetical protein